LKLLENESIEDEGNERFVGEEDVPHTQSKTLGISSNFLQSIRTSICTRK
uniref:Uncharacterized protein n=1 Tax=Amphimedon queenslandica TaxID=400682 RepID=A0A1X7TEQ9_AMPQE